MLGIVNGQKTQILALWLHVYQQIWKSETEDGKLVNTFMTYQKHCDGLKISDGVRADDFLESAEEKALRGHKLIYAIVR